VYAIGVVRIGTMTPGSIPGSRRTAEITTSSFASQTQRTMRLYSPPCRMMLDQDARELDADVDYVRYTLSYQAGCPRETSSRLLFVKRRCAKAPANLP